MSPVKNSLSLALFVCSSVCVFFFLSFLLILLSVPFSILGARSRRLRLVLHCLAFPTTGNTAGGREKKCSLPAHETRSFRSAILSRYLFLSSPSDKRLISRSTLHTVRHRHRQLANDNSSPTITARRVNKTKPKTTEKNWLARYDFSLDIRMVFFCHCETLSTTRRTPFRCRSVDVLTFSPSTLSSSISYPVAPTRRPRRRLRFDL